MKRNNKDRRRILIFVIAVVAVVFLSAALLCFTSRNRVRITEDNREYLVDNAAMIAQSVDSALTDGYSNIKMLSTLVSESLTGPDFDVATIQQHIQNSVFDFVEFADTEGMDHNITGGVSDARDRKYFLDAREGNSGMELIYVSRATHETLLMFYSPLTYEGEFVGSLVGVYQAANRITRLLSSDYFGEKALSYLATDEGRIIASNEGYDPQKEMYVTDLASGDAEAEEQIRKALVSGETAVFSLPGNSTGACMIKLPVNGGYIVQIFPTEANEHMVRNANALGYELVVWMLILAVGILASLIVFYRSQQKQIEEARNQAEIANQAKTSFLFNMSHDIRTPMNAILGYTDVGLRHVDDTERTRDSFVKIKTAGGHLLNLINDILEMSRIESGKLELSENPIDIRQAIFSTDYMSSALAVPKSIDYETVVGELRNPYIYSDELHINEVIINLISNAIKYTPEGGKVRFNVNQISDVLDGMVTYRFEISDNGIGMSEEFQRHLFEAFSREQTSTVSKQEGAGLGLSIVKKIVDLAGGSISVRSIQNEGSIFTVEIPFRVMEDETIEEFQLDNAKAAEFTGDISLSGKRVLLVEDNEMNREIATEILEESGLAVETAEDGKIALKAVQEKGMDYYDFILMDIQMPVMNGYEATEAIRHLPGGYGIPIIALSANAFDEDRKKSHEAGMNAHIAKPIDVKELFEAMYSLSR